MKWERTLANQLIERHFTQVTKLGDGLSAREKDSVVHLMSGAYLELQAEGIAVDGVTDVSSDIDDMMAYLEAKGGGVLFHRDGTIVLSQLKLRTGVMFLGGGRGSVIKQKDDTAGHLIVLDNTDVQFAQIVGVKLDGNAANQTDLNDAINLDNTGFTDPPGDSHHLIKDVWIDSFKGNGLVRGPAVREARIINVLARQCAKYGFATSVSGGTDNFHAFCTAQACGYSGFDCSGYGDRYIGCKSFANGTAGISGNKAGYLITGHRTTMSACEAQENPEHGFHLLNCYGYTLDGCNADANAGDSFLFDGATDGRVNGVAQSTPGLAYQTTWAVEFINGADRNHIDLIMVPAQLIGGVMPTASMAARANNDIHINSRYMNRVFAVASAVGVGSEEHYVWGKAGSPATGNAYWTLKTDASTPPVSSLQSWDGTTARTYLQFNHGTGRLTLGDGASVTDIRVEGTLTITTAFVAPRFDSIAGTAGSTSNEHFRFGKVSSPAAGNPYYVLKTDASATPIASLQGWDGTTARTFIRADYNLARVTLGDGVSVADIRVEGECTITANSAIGRSVLPAARLSIQGATDDNSAYGIYILDLSGNERFTQKNDGSVVITGTLTASDRITVTNTSEADVVVTKTGTGAVSATLYATTNAVGLYDITTARSVFTYRSITNVFELPLATQIISSLEALQVGSASRPVYFRSDSGGLTIATGALQTGSMVYFDAANDALKFYTASTLRATIDASGVMTFSKTVVATDALRSIYGTLASSNDEHFRFGKTSSGASGNPYFVFKTDNTAVPIAGWYGFDGTTTKTFMRADFANGKVLLGDNSVVTEVRAEAILVCLQKLIIDSASGQAAMVQAKRSDVLRFQFGHDGSTESGSNSGSNFAIFRYSDAGSYLGTPVSISRATGAIQFEAIDGALKHIGSTVGLYGVTPIARQTHGNLASFTNPGGGSYTGIDNAQAGSVYAQLVDLNDLGTKVGTIGGEVQAIHDNLDSLITKIKNIGALQS